MRAREAGRMAAAPDERGPAAGAPGPGLGPVRPIRIFTLGLLAALRAAGLVLVAEAIARGIAGAASGALDARAVIALGVAGAIVRAAAGWATQVAARRIATEVKADLRSRLWRRIADGSGGRSGGIAVLAGEGLDDLDDYYTQSLPAMVAAIAVPALVGLRILGADAVSAVVIVLTVPLVPVFMILIGRHTQERTDEATGALTRLADHLAELARGLPVLVGLGRVEEQTAALDGLQRDYRRRTMRTLRTAFLSSLALELIAMLSVALVAVLLGLRLMNGTVQLEAALVALILAPEIFGALREVGAAFHASQAGLAALKRAKALLSRRPGPDVRRPGGNEGPDEDAPSELAPDACGTAASGPVIRISGLTVRYAGRDADVVAGLDADLAGITAITGPSGAGKSTVLAALAGVLPDDAETSGGIEIPGGAGPRGAAPDPAGRAGSAPSAPAVAWVPQSPRAFSRTPREELALYGATDPGAALAEVGIAHTADAAVAEISPGELRRLAVARALARVDAGAEVLVLDEPTAHLDATAADLIRAAVRRRASRAVIVLASHEPETLALATRRVSVAPVADARDAAGVPVSSAPLAAHGDPVADHATVSSGPLAPSAKPAPSATPRPADGRSALGVLRELVRPERWRWAGAIALGFLASALGLSLTAVSGWLIVRASIEEYIAVLMVAIVGVRFFGLGRAVARYAERLATHSAVFRAIDGLRARMWRAIASRGAGSRRLLEGGSPVDYLVTQADELRDQLPRALPPIAVGALSIAAVTATTWFVARPLTPLVGVVLAAALVAGSLLAVAAERRAGSAGVAERAAIVRGTAALADAADDLRGNSPRLPRAPGLTPSARKDAPDPRDAALAVLDGVAGRAADAERRAARGAGIGAAVAALTTSVLAALVAPIAAGHGIPADRLAVIALLALAVGEPLAAAIAGAQRLPALRAGLRRVAGLIDPAPAALTGAAVIDGPIRSLELDGLAAGYPAAGSSGVAPVFAGLDAVAERGTRLVVTGPSGSGKSTLLSALMGALPAAGGEVRANGAPLTALSPEGWRRRVAWCPQQAHVFDSTLRGNLALVRGGDDVPPDAEMLAALRLAGLGGLVDALADGLDTRVGPAGSALSGGERQRLAVARALLSRADVLLLDEPTAHLDAPTARAMMADIRAAAIDRVTVLVTHRADDIGYGDRVVSLGARAARAEPVLLTH